MNYTICIMSPDDLRQTIDLWSKTDGIGLDDDSDSLPALAAYLTRNPGMSFVARSDGQELIGAVLCGHDGRRGYLHHLAVSTGYRHSGIGRALTGKCLDALRRIGIAKCNIFVFGDNATGLSFWEHNGWIERPDLHVVQKILS
jgi:N-acetylglutamate synthase